MRSCLLWPLGLSAAVVAAGPAHAASELVPEIRIAVESNDNPRLLANAGDLDEAIPRADRLMTELRLRFTAFGPRGEAVIEPALRSDVYDTAHSQLESTDGYLRSSGEYRWERTALGFAADLAREKILSSAFLEEAIDEVDTSDPGLVDGALIGANEHRTRIVLSPYTDLRLSSRGALRFDGRFADFSYGGNVVSSRTDFEHGEIGMSYRHDLSERATLATRVFGARFSAEANVNETDTAGIEVVYSSAVSELWTVEARAGVARSEFGYADATGSRITGREDHGTLGIGLRKRMERSSLRLDLRRQLSPDSFGFLAERDQLRFAVSHEISPVLNADVVLRIVDSASLGSADRQPLTFGRIALGIDWAFAARWTFDATYEHAVRDVDTPAGDASSNSLSIGVAYRGLSRRPGL